MLKVGPPVGCSSLALAQSTKYERSPWRSEVTSGRVMRWCPCLARQSTARIENKPDVESGKRVGGAWSVDVAQRCLKQRGREKFNEGKRGRGRWVLLESTSPTYTLGDVPIGVPLESDGWNIGMRSASPAVSGVILRQEC